MDRLMKSVVFLATYSAKCFLPRIIFCILLISSTTVYAQRKITEEAILFKDLRDGVFTIFGDEGHGSGFLISTSGLVLTNHHVISNSTHTRVSINDSTCVPAKIILTDDKNDIAVLQVNPLAIKDLPVMKISHESTNFAFEGERVLAIGSPLNQTLIFP